MHQTPTRGDHSLAMHGQPGLPCHLSLQCSLWTVLTGSLVRVSSLVPSVLWPSPMRRTYPAWPASAQAGPVFSRNRTRTSHPGWVGHSLLLSRSATGFSISHAGVPGNRAEQAVFNLWFYAVGRKNHSGHLLPLVISSRCLF